MHNLRDKSAQQGVLTTDSVMGCDTTPEERHPETGNAGGHFAGTNGSTRACYK